jgi:hypothetical protein
VCSLIVSDSLTRLKKLYFFQIVKERKNSDLEKTKPKSHQLFADDLRLNFMRQGGGGG